MKDRHRRGQTPEVPTPVHAYGALRLVRRGSTRVLPKGDPRVARALEYVRRHACRRGVSVGDVAAAMGCSRRRATALFRQVTGRSILDEIRERRLDEAMRLLRNPSQQIDAIADLCGYSAPSFLKRLFKSRTGLSMRAWRKAKIPRSEAEMSHAATLHG